MNKLKIYFFLLCIAGCKKSTEPVDVFFSAENITETDLRKPANIVVKVDLSDKAPNSVYLKFTTNNFYNQGMIQDGKYFVIEKGESSKTFTLPVQPNTYEPVIKVKITEAYRANIVEGRDEYILKLLIPPYSRSIQLNYRNKDYLTKDTITDASFMNVNGEIFYVIFGFGKTLFHKGYRLIFMLPNKLPVNKDLKMFAQYGSGNVNSNNGFIRFSDLQNDTEILPQDTLIGTVKVMANDTVMRSLQYSFDLDFKNGHLLKGDCKIDNYGINNIIK